MSGARLEDLLAAETPFLDVRAPAEFARGTVPGAVNLPLLTDEERHRVGITYKQQGHAAAVVVGNALVSGEARRLREQRWCAFATAHPDAWIYCWRGGQRSEIVQSWLAARGVSLPRVPGGFKSLRRMCLSVLDRAPRQKRWFVLGGRTGSGKTMLLERLPNAIDLEGLARHRGSAFGACEISQPTPVSFDNALAAAFLRHRADTLVLEDESRTIGRLALPPGWHEQMQLVPLAVLQTPLEARVNNIVREYITEPLARGVPEPTLRDRYVDSLQRIRRRLGGARHHSVLDLLECGFDNGDHGRWIEQLLVWYYDPMYDHQLERKRGRIAMQGCAESVEAWLRDR